MRTDRLRHGLGEALISLGAVGGLIAILVSVDDRVREYAERMLTWPSMSAAGDRATDLGSVLLIALRDQTVNHAPLAIFVVAGVALFLFMFRT
jgi:hypothetical protein